jgi:hypothetical protein
MSRGIVGSLIQENTVSTADPVGVKEKVETRSKRVNLLVKPSVYDEVKKKCKKTGRSFNDVVNILLEDWIEKS